MRQWLPRGLTICSDKRIRRMLCAGQEWQIYAAEKDVTVLAVSLLLYRKWISEYLPSDRIFYKYLAENTEYYLFCSTKGYLVSSLAFGPFPTNKGQIEAFSIAYREVRRKHPNADLRDAVYVEEYALILPGDENRGRGGNDIVYGRWITGGIELPADRFYRIAQIMSWLPEEELYKYFKLAGYDVSRFWKVEHEMALKSDNGKKSAVPVGDLVQPTEDFCLVGRPELERFFRENIIDIIFHKQEYQRMGITFPGATVLYGPPGCGKTFAVDRLTEYLGWKRFDIDASSIASSYIHDTSKKISEVFDAAIQAAPSIVVIDEMEAFLSNRDMASASGTHHMEEVAEFLRQIPAAVASEVLIFAMTNMIDAIDPAILRRGRFDHIVEVKMASGEEVEELLKAQCEKLPIEETVDLKAIAVCLDGHPMSDIAFVLREAGRIAVKNQLSRMDNTCFQQALSMLPPQKSKRTIGF